MSTPDDIVEANGDPVTHVWVSSFAYGMGGPEDVEMSFAHTKAVISNPSEADEQRLEGRIDSGAKRFTVNSDRDVRASREGGREYLILGHVDPSEDTDLDIYHVQNVADDEHNLVGIRKKTVIADRYSGRSVIEEPATWRDEN